MLRQAFQSSDNVYLVFSANKSGEFFGLARMRSSLYTSKSENNPPSLATQNDLKSPEPQSMITAASDGAPAGKVYDDSVRGTIFWEASRTPVVKDSEEKSEASQRRQFDVDWLSTSRVPFFRTRGLRNPWNGLKEIKIARDGTELEPNVGRHLIRLFV